ncbi:MAG: hypothetical protein ACLU84_04985 [Clostridia bacterium]
MKKILLIILIILLTVGVYFAIGKGISIGNIHVLSMTQISDQNTKLNTKIEEANQLIDLEYPKKMSNLKAASSEMMQAKDEYLKLTNISTDEQILKATRSESYSIEFLWATIGNHATAEGVNLKFEILSNDTGTQGVYNLGFTVDGNYVAIINFISAIENDSKLNFRVQNFKLVPYQQPVLRATFTVKNIGIEGNNSAQAVTTTQTNTEENTQTNNQTDTNTTTNTNTTNTENGNNVAQ